MGRGNWFPGHNLDECEVCYVDITRQDEDYDDDLASMDWDDFRFVLQDALPDSFEWEPSHANRYFWVGRDDSCIALNGLFGVFVDNQGENYHLGIGVMVRDDAPAFARSHLQGFSEALFDRIQEAYPEVSLRSSAWTSCKRVPGKVMG